ncbi:hypothetical protein BJ508DRAFT_365408 [Ascobolus immersus RN42]|uniref:VPS9 domain-containing protein n=1 Tax=Ascobolus immersus RN42 TaxID=1160509 RepID=A0A3N4HVE7_ASCIM|nr:hypothetical protein BJ508DRAFT_365408 [Ascobolus immersus RN42]
MASPHGFPDKVDVPTTSPAPPTSETDKPVLRNARSFKRLEPSSTSLETSPLNSTLVTEDDPLLPTPASALHTDDEKSPAVTNFPDNFDELPPEILALTDRFIESLSAKIHPAPLTASQLSDLFQDFYALASSHISTYISTLYLALKSKSGHVTKEQQMLSFEELTQKRRDRKLLEAKKLAIEEAVEKKVTEAVYERIWRHKTTDDEARDETLRSKIAALGLCGVKAVHLGIEEGVSDEAMIEALVEPRKALLQVSAERSPLAKLNVLRTIHKSIVDVLTSLGSSSHSSADQILPTLIFTLLHAHAEINIASDLFFIQRFRSKERIDGEAAYCLTNLEAAITFLETVDLATLHLEDALGPPSRASLRQAIPGQSEGDSSPQLPFVPPDNPLKHLEDKLADAHHAHLTAEAERLTSPITPSFPTTSLVTAEAKPTGQRKPINLLAPVEMVGSAVVSTASTGINTLNTTLESSYRFLFSRIQTRSDVAIPKTLEEARNLVSPKLPEPTAPLATLFDEPSPPSERSSLDTLPTPPLPSTTHKMERSPSSHSVRSNRSSRSVASARTPTRAPRPALATNASNAAHTAAHHASNAAAAAAPAAAAVVGALGFGLRGIAGIGMRGFRGATSLASSTASSPVVERGNVPDKAGKKEKENNKAEEAKAGAEDAREVDLLKSFPELAETLSPAASVTSLPLQASEGKRKVEEEVKVPEIRRKFLRGDVGELRLGEVEELLGAYRELVGFLVQKGVVEDPEGS